MPEPRVHETAVVEPGARLGPDTAVWHHAHVRAGASVGGGTSLGKNVYVDADVTIGAGVKIQNNVSVYRGVSIEDDVFVGPSAVFTNDRHPRAFGDDWEVVPTLVRRGASIGANATIVCGNDIGTYAAVAAGAVVTRSVLDHELVAGNPARRLGWVCECGRVASRAEERPDDVRCELHRGRADTMIPISALALGIEEEQLVGEVLRSGRLAQGPMVERLEAAFAELTGARHAIAVSSGTTALVVALEALGLEPGDEVVTSPFTFVATLNAVLEAGATATFADVGDDFCLAPSAAAAACTPRTRALVPVDLYGLPADLPAFTDLAKARGCALVEDAAQAHGAAVGERAAGSFGIGCFSLYATKNVTTGEGGIITTDDAEVADRIRLLRNQGMRRRYEYVVAGHNYRMTEIQAAVGIPQMARLARANAARAANAATLTAGLADVPGLVVPGVPEGRTHVWHQYTVRVTDAARLDRDALAAALAERGIATGVYYPRLVFDYECYREHPRVHLAGVPNAEAAARQVLSLPVHPMLGDGDLARIVEETRELLGC